MPNTASGGQDDLCWMMTNLAYEGGGNNTYSDTMDLTNRNTGRWDTPLGADSIPNSVPFVRTNITANVAMSNATLFTSTPTPPSSNVQQIPNANSGAGLQTGFHYNWCAAMGGQTNACNDTETNQNNIDENVSICPSGWRLPTAGNSGSTADNSPNNEFWNLNQRVNGGSPTSPQGLLDNWLGLLTGTVGSSGGGMNDVGVRSDSWSSTILNATSTRSLGYSELVVNPTQSSSKTNGRTVRCVAP